MFGLFALGSLSFWLLLVMANLFMFKCTDKGWAGWSTFSVIVTAGLLQLAGVPIWQHIVSEPYSTLAWVGGYFIAGTLWAVSKWWFFVRHERRKYDQARLDFMKQNNLTEIPKDKLQEFWNFCRWPNEVEIKPSVKDHKALIYFWMSYWPWSCVWTIINDPVKRIIDGIYDRIKTTLQKISDKVWADAHDLPK